MGHGLPACRKSGGVAPQGTSPGTSRARRQRSGRSGRRAQARCGSRSRPCRARETPRSLRRPQRRRTARPGFPVAPGRAVPPAHRCQDAVAVGLAHRRRARAAPSAAHLSSWPHPVPCAGAVLAVWPAQRTRPASTTPPPRLAGTTRHSLWSARRGCTTRASVAHATAGRRGSCPWCPARSPTAPRSASQSSHGSPNGLATLELPPLPYPARSTSLFFEPLGLSR